MSLFLLFLTINDINDKSLKKVHTPMFIEPTTKLNNDPLIENKYKLYNPMIKLNFNIICIISFLFF